MERVYATPHLDADEQKVLEEIDGLRDRLRHHVAPPRRWFGTLRRTTFARAVQGSNSIEGYDASLDDVAAAVDGEPTLGASHDTELALTGYRDALTYVLQVAQDSTATVDEGLLRSLHFMMLKHELGKGPGRWRPGPVFVRREQTGEQVYAGPPAERVPGLVRTMLDDLRASKAPVLVRAALAHLNLVMIHPFRDGNGRMARALQTLVFAREGATAPVFASIEEYLGRRTQSYYDVLAEVGAGAWHPENDARPWVRFCLTAHLRQAQTHLRRVQEIEQLYAACARLVAERRLPDRTTGALADAANGFRLRNASYRSVVEETAGEVVSDLTASRDLRALVEAGLLRPVGERRGRYYLAEQVLLDARRDIRADRPPRSERDPFPPPAALLTTDA